MKANSLEELVTNSNIEGELRNYTDWHDRLVRFAQMVADWQKEALLEWAKERYKSTISNVGCYTGHSVWAEVIEKLESL